MFYYRKNYPEEAIDTQDAYVGTIVHKMIELYPAGPYDTNVLEQMLGERQVDLSGRVKVMNCLSNYYTKFPHILERMNSNVDKSEFYFKEKIAPDVTMSGKMDYVVREENIIYDWKTGQTKRDISNDIQFIIYYTMYQRMFGVAPSVYQVNLTKGEEVLFIPRKIYIDTLFDEIIPKIVSAINNKEYFKEGYFNGSCYRCSFIAVCARDP